MATMNITATAPIRSNSRHHRVERRAVETVCMLLRQPALLRNVLGHDIPTDILVLLKIVAGRQDVLDSITREHELSASEVLAVTKLYLQGILISAGNNDRRMLCLPSNAKAADVQEHKKWLLKWLHPDRNPDSWESALFVKVNSAAARLLANKNFDSDLQHQPPIHEKNKHAKFRRKSDMTAYRKPRPTGILRRVTRPFIIVAAALAVLVAVLEVSLTPKKQGNQNTVLTFDILKLFR
jgi:hypothetical protein